MHVPSILFGIILGALGAAITVSAAIVAADLLNPPPAYGPVR